MTYCKKMKLFSGMILLLMALFFLPEMTVQAAGNTYYIDAVDGNDTNDGFSPGTAFQTLGKLNAMTFGPGDKILFKQGCTWNGHFEPKGSGTSQAPIIVNAYDSNGNEAVGAVPLSEKPYIKNNGADQTGDIRVQYQRAYAVYLKNVEYWELNNLQCSVDNDDVWQGTFGDSGHFGDKWSSPVNKGRNWVGIMVEARDYYNNGDTVINHVYIKDSYVHDVDGNYALWHKDGFSGGITYLVWTDAYNDGIFSAAEQGSTPINTFEDILVENCYVEKASRAGITVGTSVWSDKFSGYGGDYPGSLMHTYGHKNVVIRNNVVNMTTGDGIEVLYTSAPLVEYNLAIKPGTDTIGNDSDEFTSAGIWAWRSPDAVFQYNECYGVTNYGDGQAWDVDWTNGAIYQYNYSHDNRGGAILYCLEESIDSTFRYNISQNDRYFVDDFASGPGHKIYNNTFIAGPYTTGVFRRVKGQHTVENNIFYAPTPNTVFPNWDSYDTYDNNLYHNINAPASDRNPVYRDPMFVGSVPVMDAANPAFAVSGTLLEGPHNTADYLAVKLAGVQLQPNSGAINAGKVIADNGGKDFFGNTLYNGTPDIGAHEVQGNLMPDPDPVPNPTTNLISGKAVTASNEHSGSYNPVYAIDGDMTTRWATDGVSSAWLEVYFGKQTTFDKVVIKEFDSRIQAYQIQYWDGTNWVNAVTGTTVGAEKAHVFTPVTSDTIRLNISNATSAPSIYEFEAYISGETPDSIPSPGPTTNLVLNKSSSASNEHSSGSFNAGKAIDADAGTRWAVEGKTSAWLVVYFGAQTTFDKAVIKEYGSRIQAYQIQYWDGYNWLTAHRGTTIGAEKTDIFAPVTTTKLRFSISNATSAPSIYELEVYNSGETVPQQPITLSKNVVTLNDTVDVTLNAASTNSQAWIGLYQINETPGGPSAIWWSYLTDVGISNGNGTFTLDLSAVNNSRFSRADRYKLVVFKDGQYAAESGTYFDLVDQVVTGTGNLNVLAISDVHVSDTTAEQKLQNVFTNVNTMVPGLDGVLIAGDFTDYGHAVEYDRFVQVYNQYANQNAAKMFVMGNHDYGTYDAAEARSRFEQKTGEKINSHKVIKGYHFIQISTEDSGIYGTFNDPLKNWLRNQIEVALNDDPEKPIFINVHQPSMNTVIGGDEWGSGALGDVLRDYPQVVLFAGHIHYPLNDERSIHQGQWSSVATGSIKYMELESGAVQGHVPPGARDISHGLIMNVDENTHTVTLKRMEFTSNQQIKDNWVITSPRDKNQYTYTDDRYATNVNPYFESTATLQAAYVQPDTINITFDQAADDDMVHSYRIQAVNRSNNQVDQEFLAFSEFYLYPAVPDQLTFDIAGLSSTADYDVLVTAIDSFGKESITPLSAAPGSNQLNNLVLNKTARASNEHSSGSYNAVKAIDDDPVTRWAVEGKTGVWLEVDFGEQTTFDKVIIKEYESRVQAYQIQYWDGYNWLTAHSGTTIGPRKADIFTPVTSTKFRLGISNATADPSIYELQVYNSGEAVPQQPITLSKNVVTLNDTVAVTLNNVSADSKAWIGLYQINEVPGGPEAIWWKYLPELGINNGNGSFTLDLSTINNSRFSRADRYELVVFEDGQYNIDSSIYFDLVDQVVAGTGDIKVLTISDVHTSDTEAEQKLQTVLMNVNAAVPDLDGVVIAGDIADYGTDEEYDRFVQVYDQYANPNAAKMFVMGNHDYYGTNTADQARTRFEQKTGENVNSHKIIKGYHFIQISTEDHETPGTFNNASKNWLRNQLEIAVNDDSAKPVFVTVHQPSKDTVIGGTEWGTGALDEVLQDYPQAVVFAGHVHYPINDERSIHQEHYTTVATASVRYMELESGKIQGVVPPGARSDIAHGLIMKVDVSTHKVTLTRMEFMSNTVVKDDWVINTPRDKTQFTYTDDRYITNVNPNFEGTATLQGTYVQPDTLSITFEQAKDEDMVHSYRIQAVNQSNGQTDKEFLAFSEFYLYPAVPGQLTFDIAGLSTTADYEILVTAIDSFGKESTTPLNATFLRP